MSYPSSKGKLRQLCQLTPFIPSACVKVSEQEAMYDSCNHQAVVLSKQQHALSDI